MTELTIAKKRDLSAKAHHLKPVIIVGTKGLTETVLAEIKRALFDHELIKIKIVATNKEALIALIDKICGELEAALIKTVGYIVVLYRKSDKFT